MKTPRVTDFDPKAKPPALKSSLEGMPTIQKEQSSMQPEKPVFQSEPTRPERANAPTPERPNGKRIITRNSFETYEDQMEALRKLSFKEKMEGKVGSMSKMVRDAIDEYLEKRSSEI